jgi:hypothetical protein
MKDLWKKFQVKVVTKGDEEASTLGDAETGMVCIRLR